MSVMAAFKTTDNNRASVWNKVVIQAKWRSEMGAYLAMSPRVEKWDRVALGLQLHAIVGLAREYKKDRGWSGACLDMGLMQLVSRLDTINHIASRYPDVVRQYKSIQEKAHKGQRVNEPKTKFIRTWEGHFRQPLLDAFVHQCNKEGRTL